MVQPKSRRLLRPVVDFIQTEASGGLLLIAAAVASLAWANSSASESYFQLWATDITVGFLTKTAHHWINDGLMAVFFLLVGLEIKRELLVGELSTVRKATLPIAAAVGGMVVPAGIYAVLNAGKPTAAGWGIPMATDIAFALGVLTMLGPRVPLALKVFLAALAIVDDIGAVAVIALFYTSNLDTGSLVNAIVVFLVLGLLNVFGVRKITPYMLFGLALWVFVLKSGIHASIAGVLLAATIPTRVRINGREYAQRCRAALTEFESAREHSEVVEVSEARQTLIAEVEHASAEAQMPLERLQHGLHPWVTYAIVPLFAFANAGVSLGAGLTSAMKETVGIGVVTGLVIGKPVGIALTSWLAVAMKWAELPAGVGWRQVFGVGMLGGIGFTMSLFIAELGLEGANTLNAAKAAVLVASLVAGLAGYAILRKPGRVRSVAPGRSD